MYNPANWYWRIGTDETQVWSSVHAQLVPADNADYLAWKEQGNITSKVSVLNDAIKITIDVLEASVTPRRLREAVLGTDDGWLESLNTQVATLRAELT